MSTSLRISRYMFLIISFLFMWGIYSGNYDNGDFIYYEQDFSFGIERFEDLHIEPLFALLNDWGKNYLGCSSYLEFKTIFSFVFMIPYWYTINKWSESAALTLCFFIPIFLLQVIIVRNFIGFSIVQLALPLLIQPSRKNLILFAGVVLIAQGVHNMMFMYLLAYLSIFKLKIFNSPFKYFIMCLLGGVIMGGILMDQLAAINTSKYNGVIDLGTNVLRMAIGVFLIINYYVLRYIKNTTIDSANERVCLFENFVLRLNLIFMALIVTFVMSMVSSRIFINLLLLNMIFVANRLYRSYKTDNQFCIMTIPYVCFWIWYVVFIVISGQLDDVIGSNYFVNYLFN